MPPPDCKLSILEYAKYLSLSFLIQIITDLLPYHNDASDMAILRSIIDDRLPADVVNLRIPAIISLLLNDCWKKEPEMRLSMSRCAESLYDQALTRRSPLLNLSSYPDVDDPQGRTVRPISLYQLCEYN